MKIKFILLISFLSITLLGFNSYTKYNAKNFLNRTTKDSIWILKSETINIKNPDSNKNNDSTEISKNCYHIINFSKAEITLCILNSKEDRWENKTLKYYSTLESSEKIEFNTNSSEKIHLYINPLNLITYSFDDNRLYAFSNIKKVGNEELDKIGMSISKDSYKPKKSIKKIAIKQHIKNFEYSDYWRKESYKKAIEYIKLALNKDKQKCKMVSRGFYNPTLVQYIGNQGFLVKIYCEFDCNQNYINQSYFWVEAYYLGYGKWNLELVDQRLTH